MPSISIGIVIKKHRKLANLTQEQLAYMAGLNRGYISLLEKGQRSPKLETLQRLALALRIPLTTLIYEFEFGNDQEKRHLI